MNNIKAIRESKAMTQFELGKKIGVGQSAVAMWESGKCFPKPILLPKLAEILDCTTDELLGIAKKSFTGSEKAE